MNGKTHRLVANLALACLDMKERHILYPRWGGIESGSTLSDEFRIMWESEAVGSKNKQLVHRYYVDSKDPKNHGCVTRALDHAEGSVCFIKDYLSSEDPAAYTEVEFLENMGMFLGILSHHISDLCTPVHVGHKMDYSGAGAKSRADFHRSVERDVERYSNQASIILNKPRKISLVKSYFQNIASETYASQFVNLERIYSRNDVDGKIAMSSWVISNSVKHTVDVWHSILARSGMLKKSWSMQPLL